MNRDNTVSFQNLSLQIEAVRWRATLAGCQVTVHQHLDGTLSLTHGPHLLGRYTAEGATQSATKMPAQRAVEKPRVEKSQTRLSHRAWKSRKLRGIPTSHSPDCCWLTMKPDISLATKSGHFNLLTTAFFLWLRIARQKLAGISTD